MDSLSDYPIIVKVDGIETPVTLSDPLHREVRFSAPIDPHSTVVAEAWAGNPYFAAADLLEQSAGDPDKQTLIIAQGNIKFLDGKSPAESLRDQAALLRLRGMPVSIGLGGFR
jgi:hypothetical protein